MPKQPDLFTPTSGQQLEAAVAEVATRLGLAVKRQVKVGRRIYGPVRHIDIVATDTGTRRSLGIECKFQKQGGTAEEKIPGTILDIGVWPIPGILCFAGGGFSDHMLTYMYSTGRAVALDDLEDYLRLFFVL